MVGDAPAEVRNSEEDPGVRAARSIELQTAIAGSTHGTPPSVLETANLIQEAAALARTERLQGVLEKLCSTILMLQDQEY